MNALYKLAHVYIDDSAYEGFPMLIKESMSFGCVPVVTALEGNKMHLKDDQNALLINNIENPESVIQQGIDKLQLLISDASRYNDLSDHAYEYARNNFSKQKFIAGYRKLLI
jgi:glycosyltransferase involved in cell wall biosynthesis